MSLVEFLILVAIAGVCGSLAQSLAGYSRGGCFTSIALGFVGALLGTWLVRKLELPMVFSVSVGGQKFPIVWSILGAALFSGLLSLLTSRRAV